MNERQLVTLRSALLAGGIAALAVCTLAMLDAMWRGRATAAFFFASPLILTVIFALTRPRPGGPTRGS